MQELLLNNYGLAGIFIAALVGAVGVLYRENLRLHKQLEDLVKQSIKSEEQTRRVLEQVVEGLSAQDLITRYIERLQNRD